MSLTHTCISALRKVIVPDLTCEFVKHYNQPSKMNRVIIGSSNVYRYYNKATYTDYNDYILLKCVHIKSFEVILATLGKDDKEVIVSVLENFLDRAGSGETTEEGYLLKLGETMEEYGRIIGESSMRNPGTKFSIVDPIWRPKLEWYQNLYDDIITTCKETGLSIRSLLKLTLSLMQYLLLGTS